MIALIAQYVPASVWAALGGLVAVLGVWLTGRRQGAVAAKNKAAARNADAAAKAKAVRDEVDSISGDDVSKRLSKWQRK